MFGFPEIPLLRVAGPQRRRSPSRIPPSTSPSSGPQPPASPVSFPAGDLEHSKWHRTPSAPETLSPVPPAYPTILPNLSFHQIPFPQDTRPSVAGLLSGRGPGTLKMAQNTISTRNIVAGLPNKKGPGTKNRGTEAKDRRSGVKHRGPGAKGRRPVTHCQALLNLSII